MNKVKKQNKGFTLIELLVAILIVGILVAICLPQYHKATIKTRYNSLKTIATNIAQAEERYYMIHDTYTKNMEDLDIEIGVRNDGRNFFLNNNDFCLSDPDFMNCYLRDKNYNGLRVFQIYYSFVKGSLVNKRRCLVPTNISENSIYHQICQEETGRKESSSRTSSYNVYSYN